LEYSIGDILALFGSLALFLYGMKAMSDALMEVAGDSMRRILASMTSNRVFAVFTGFLITAAIQSSSATTLMVVSFVNASLLTLTEAVGVILGANIGTTVTAWLITLLGFKVSMSAIAIPLVAVGFLMSFSKKARTKHWGEFIIGFAILFIGLQFLKDSIPDIKQNPEILEFLKHYTGHGFWSILLFLIIGTLLTIIVQSSSATMALTLLMCYEGWIPYDIAAAMVLGENIGTTITANLAALVGNFHAKRAARAHFVVNLLGVIVVLSVFYPFLRGLDHLVLLTGSASPFVAPEAVPVALSLFHTFFNVANMLLLIGFVPLIVRLVVWMVPEISEPERQMEQPRFLTSASLVYPQTGIRALIDESKRLYENTIYKVIVHGLNAHRSDVESDIKIKEVISRADTTIDIDIDALYYDKIKVIYGKIVEYATQLQSKFSLEPDKIELIRRILIANRDIVEVVKNMKALHRNIINYTRSDNEYIRKEYNALRKMILKVVREIRDVAETEHMDKHLQKMEKLRNKAKKSDVLMTGTIDELIRKNLITSQMASSLINDSAIAIEMCMHLMAYAELLYAHQDTILENVKVEAHMLVGEEPLLSHEERDELSKTLQ
jgi:phosphate:Na+ symporter